MGEESKIIDISDMDSLFNDSEDIVTKEKAESDSDKEALPQHDLCEINHKYADKEALTQHDLCEINNKFADNTNVPKLIGTGYPKDYIDVVEQIQQSYSEFPSIDYDVIYHELSELAIKSSPTPTLQVFNNELQKVQGAKDRLAEIFITVVKNYTFKKRAVDILKDSWGKFGDEKNAEKRKGDASFRVSRFEIDLAETEALFKACNHIIKNLDSLSDNLSRRITTVSLQLKMQDFGRHGLPDSDFSESTIDSILGKSSGEDIDENEEIEPKEESF